MLFFVRRNILILTFLLINPIKGFSLELPWGDSSSPSRSKVYNRINGLKLSKEGPNCWNGALIKAGLAQSVRFVPLAEYWFWMNSPYCKKLGPNDKPKMGDLGSLFWEGKGHYHSFTYINSHWVFSKNSPDPKYEYKIQRFEDMFFPEYKNTAKKCWGNILKSSASDCKFKVEFHRCNPIDLNFFNEDQEMTRWMSKIVPIEETIYQWVKGTGAVTLKEYEKAIIDLNNILHEVHSKSRVQLTKLKIFKLEALEYRLMGLILSDIKISLKSSKLHTIITNVYKAQKEKSIKTGKSVATIITEPKS